MRFLLGHFQRACTFLRHPCDEGNNESSSWKSLFFYRCTDVISFAPLRSQGVDSRLDHIRERTTVTAPPPCSPKSIYVLANSVRQLSTGHLTHDTDISCQARDSTSMRERARGYQKQSILGKCRGRTFLAGDCRVGMLSGSNLGVSIGLTLPSVRKRSWRRSVNCWFQTSKTRYRPRL